MIELQKENEEAISHENVRSLLFLHKNLLCRQSAQRKGEEIMDQKNKERALAGYEVEVKGQTVDVEMLYPKKEKEKKDEDK